MRRTLLATLAAALVLAATPSSQAQREAMPAVRAPNEVLRPVQPPQISFRMRSAEERLASVRRLEAEARRRAPRAPVAPMTLTLASFSDTFQVTARAPHVPGQGSLYLVHATLDSRPDPNGEVVFPHSSTPNSASSPESHGRFMIQLYAPDTRRLLVECTVWGNAAPFRGYLYRHGGQELWSDHSTPYQGVISFLTPPTAESDLRFGVWPTNPNPGMYGWVLAGCQVTRLALP
jgi:hypothetical protein